MEGLPHEAAPVSEEEAERMKKLEEHLHLGRLHKHQRETEIAATHQPPKFTMETGKRDPEEAAAVLGSPSGEETAATSAKERQQHERQRMEHMQGAKETVSREEIERLVKQKHALAGNAPDADLEIAAARGRGGGAEMPTNEEKEELAKSKVIEAEGEKEYKPPESGQ